jgi:osmotically-inducible protein OsmY
MKFRIVRAALAIILCVPAMAPAQPQPDTLQLEVTRSVTTYSRYTVFDDVRAHIDGGTVTLSGKVTWPVKKDDLGKRVAALHGVTAVRNEIEVLPPLRSDDELRHRVGRAIYSNAAFWRYAAMSTPPIRILVERGRVTLTGIVANESDRMLARSLATGLGEASLSCELRTER